MKLYLAKEKDKKTIKEIYESVKNKGFCVWNEKYPLEIDINEDIKAKSIYLLYDKKEIVGAISLNPIHELDDSCSWKSNNACELVRVVIVPKYHGKHYSKYLIEKIIPIARKKGYDSIHLAVAQENPPAVQLYRSFNFDFVSFWEFDNHKYYLCELIIK